MALSQTESLISQVLVLNAAVSALAAASPNRATISAYLEEETKRSIAMLNAKPASDELIASVEAGISALQKILLSAPEAR